MIEEGRKEKYVNGKIVTNLITRDVWEILQGCVFRGSFKNDVSEKNWIFIILRN